jgi:transcriptional regulator with XRE-family HTH domain
MKGAVDVMWDAKAFGRAIQVARKSQGLTQEQVGERVGVSAQAVSKWENGETCPEVALLPQVCSVLEVSADALLGTAQSQGFDALVRALRDRLNGMPAEQRAPRLSTALGQLLTHMTDERVEQWAGEDFLTAGRGREEKLHAATLLTKNGSVMHVHGTADLAGPEMPDEEIVQGLGFLADPDVIALFRRLVPEGKEGTALRAEARDDARVRATCDRLVEAGYLELRRDGYGLTATGLFIAATILLLAEVPGLAGNVRRVRRVHSYGGSW